MFSSKQIAKDLIDALERGVNADELAHGLSDKILASSQRSQLENVLFYLKEYSMIKKEEESLTIESASEVSKGLLSKIVNIFDVEEASVEVKKDPKLIAGFRVRHRDRLYDATLSTRLDKLRKALI